VTAYSYPCAYSAAQNKPLWGIVHWNKEYMTFDPLSFQENIHIGIHEIIHIMGFSQLLYQFFETGSMTNFGRGNYMTGPFINA
jgi:predicted metallopeptidase